MVLVWLLASWLAVTGLPLLAEGRAVSFWKVHLKVEAKR